MFRRVSKAQTPTKTGTSQAAHTLEALLKTSEWERLSDTERAHLSAPFPALTTRAERAELLLRTGAAMPVQDWLATTISRQFQSYVATGVQNWLATAPPNAHLYVGGDATFGIPQLVASLARQKVTDWPAPSSYCFVPDPSVLAQSQVLALPLGTGDAFAQTLSDALTVIRGQWGDAANRQATIGTRIATLLHDAPAVVQDYLTRLRNALLQFATTSTTAPWSGDNNALPVGSVSPEPTVTQGAPVVDATAPGTSLTDALLQANGGVLIVSPNTIDVSKLLMPLAKCEVSVSDDTPAIPLTVRVVLVGTSDAYDSLWSNSPFIGQLFRYELWSQDITTWNQNAEASYAALVTGVAAYYALPAPTVAAIGRIIQEGGRRASGLNRSRLTVDLLALHDIIVESGNIARRRLAITIGGEDVDTALEQRRAVQRANVFWVHEAILSGESITPTSGSAVGQINGLGVLEMHPWEGTFAVPMRISATVAPGRDEQFLDIERDAAQADDSHVRGLLTMEGYFAHHYGQKFPLSLSARIRFEQEHGSTGGDSASAAELFALLSALTGIPIRSSIAVTGAVGQYGEMQPIGGVNFKIEGFWDLCRTRRTLGEQAEGGNGVIIPATNARDLMLRPATAQSIATEGWFQVWLANTVDEAIPLLMGVAAATVHERVEQRLAAYYAQSQRARSGR